MASEYGLHMHLDSVRSGLSWLAFRTYLNGLMAANTRVARRFAPKDGGS